MIKTKREHGTVRHILADGTVLDSIEGYVVPPTGDTESVYRFLTEYFLKHHQMEKMNKTKMRVRGQ